MHEYLPKFKILSLCALSNILTEQLDLFLFFVRIRHLIIADSCYWFCWCCLATQPKTMDFFVVLFLFIRPPNNLTLAFFLFWVDVYSDRFRFFSLFVSFDYLRKHIQTAVTITEVFCRVSFKAIFLNFDYDFLSLFLQIFK